MKNVVFAGVGGQGVILASKILMQVAMDAGYDVKESEIHGMAQRGGSVECNVRFGEKVYSPLVQSETADFLVSFEILEAVRKIGYLAPDGMLISNLDRIDPSTVQTGAMTYPDDIEPWISTSVPNHKLVETREALREVGNRKALNIVMLGVLSQYCEFDELLWEDAIRKVVKDKFVEMNLKAFRAGRDL